MALILKDGSLLSSQRNLCLSVFAFRSVQVPSQRAFRYPKSVSNTEKTVYNRLLILFFTTELQVVPVEESATVKFGHINTIEDHLLLKVLSIAEDH